MNLKKFSLSLSLSLLILLLYSCDDESNSSLVSNDNAKASYTNAELIDSMYVVGSLHNDIITSIFQKYESIADTLYLNDSANYTISPQFMNWGYESTEWLKNYNNITFTVLNLDSLYNPNFTTFRDFALTEGYSGLALAYCSKIDTILDQYELSGNQTTLSSDCDNLISVLNNMNNDTLEIIIGSAVAVIKSSSELWTPNMDVIYDNIIYPMGTPGLISSNKNIIEKQLSSAANRRILQADGAGAISGAASGAKRGVQATIVTGGGVAAGAVAGAMAGAAIGASYASAVQYAAEKGYEVPWWVTGLVGAAAVFL